MRFHASADRGTLFESGDELIDRIRNAIVARRPVLVTGPRGSGKTHCVREAISLAIKAGEIGGSRFLQGNREIPRDYLSEDMLVVGEGADGKPSLSLRDALVIRHPKVKGKELKTQRIDAKNDVWPAVEGDAEANWKKGDWTALFLDEVNRFGDGFLDSLLSLTEERTVVRSGDELRVPLTVLATANPPGYDVTAKKLSPPLQSRMARSYRVAQPSLEALSIGILPGLVQRHCPNGPRAAPDTFQVCSGIGLCLWGMPSEERKGCGFLTTSTIALLKRAAAANSVLAQAMTELGELVAFGPDARSIGDWLAAAAGAASGSEETITDAHLLDTVLEALSHKLRETFNEGVEPGKAVRLAELVVIITRTILGNPALRALFVAPYPRAAQQLLGLPGEPSRDATYIVARRFAALPETVEKLAAASSATNDAAQPPQANNQPLLGVPQLRALEQLERDFTRRAANTPDQQVRDEMTGHAAKISARLESVYQATLTPSQLCSHLQTSNTLPPHVVRRLERALPDKALAVPEALAAVDMIDAALETAAGPAPNAPLLMGFSPALLDLFSRLLAKPRIDWLAHAKGFGVQNEQIATAIGDTLDAELSHAAKKRLSLALAT